MKNLTSKYNPKVTEEKWYNYWLENNYFHSEPDNRPSYTIVIPPPNVTGILHMGHMLNNTIQDVLIRKARMSGFNACWVPGTDHASIATEAKVVAKLKAEGIDKKDIGREAFLEHAWNWTDVHGGKILEQLKKLGTSCDWERTKFTLDDDLTASVQQVFVDLFKKGKIYRGYRMINWDPEAGTNISDEEVIHKEKQGKLYYIKYKYTDSGKYFTVATTRPETIFGDVAICVNPTDERYKGLIGKTVLVPLINREIPIIADDYVDPEFGTGALKITPAHDVNDYNIGKKFDLEIIDVIDKKGNLNHHAVGFEGLDRFKSRKLIEKALKEKNALLKTEDHKNKVGTSERTGAIIEPKLSVQWFLQMEDMAKTALDAVESGEVKLHPSKFNNSYKRWMENCYDWNISRQLWWGHQIPAFYYGEGLEEYVVAMDVDSALIKAKEKSGNSDLTVEDIKQDEDVLDTWFSSWLWPITVFNGILEPNNKEIEYYYPTQDIVTGPDILFFWVARMVMAGYEFTDKQPFNNVYLTGIVRDKQGRKMSKSLGNSPDPIELMQKYGADGVRVGLLLSSSAGNDLLFDEDLCLQGRNFANKIWNAFRLINGWETEESEVKQVEKDASAWFEAKFQETLANMEIQYEQFRISEGLMALYKLVWDDFCSWYLEAIKPEYQTAISSETKEKAIYYLEQLIKLLHPFMPFLTEEIWQNINDRSTEEALVIADYPISDNPDVGKLEQFALAREIVSSIRNLRKDNQISPKESLTLYTDKTYGYFETIVKKLANIDSISSDKAPDDSHTFRVGKSEFFVPLSSFINVEQEIEKIQKERDYLQGFLKSVEKKLSNERFVKNAPEKVIEIERQKQKDALDKLTLLQDRLLQLNQ